MRRFLWGLGGAVALGAAVLVAARWGAEPVVRADRPDVMDLVVASTLDFRTAYLSGQFVVQVDVAAERLTLDDLRHRVTWDGTTLLHTLRKHPTEALPAEWASRVRVVWDEWRAGFPNATFVDASPRELDPYWHIGRTELYYRIDLPYPWLAPYAVYVRTNIQGTYGSLTVMDRETKRPLEVGGYKVDKILFTEAERDVPLDPDTYSADTPEYAVLPTSRGQQSSRSCSGRCPKRHLPWHDLQTFVAMEPDEQNNGNGATVWNTCPKKGAVESISQRLVFRMPPDPDRVALAMAAARECDNAVFHMAIEGSHDPGPGQRSCFSGTWSVVDTAFTPPLSLLSRRFERCRNGPSDDTLPFEVELPLPEDYDLTNLEVRLESNAEIRCQKKLTTAGGTSMLVATKGRPTLSWPGCYPGLDP